MFSIHTETVIAKQLTERLLCLQVKCPGGLVWWAFSTDPVSSLYLMKDLWTISWSCHTQCLAMSHRAVSLFVKQAVTSWPCSRSSWTEGGNGKEAFVVAKSWSGARKAGSEFSHKHQRFSTFKQYAELFVHMKNINIHNNNDKHVTVPTQQFWWAVGTVSTQPSPKHYLESYVTAHRESFSQETESTFIVDFNGLRCS